MDYSYELKIPASRVAVLIGKGGETKKKVEESTGMKITVDSKEGDIFLTGEDALGLYTAREIVTAIGRGFNPEIALLLLKPDYAFEQVNLAHSAKGKNHFIRIKGRVIGAEGKSRRLIEELTECSMSVFGKTICIIGEIHAVAICRKAVEMIIKGSRHATVYRFLEKQRREMKKKLFAGEL
jgi:ribosomal RNA assembly protein